MANSRSRGVAYEDPAIVGGTVDNTPVGATTASTGAFTTLTASGATTLNGAVAIGDAAGDLVAFHGASDISVVNIVFTGSPDWTFHLLNCSRVHVRDWTQHGDERWPNK